MRISANFVWLVGLLVFIAVGSSALAAPEVDPQLPPHLSIGGAWPGITRERLYQRCAFPISAFSISGADGANREYTYDYPNSVKVDMVDRDGRVVVTAVSGRQLFCDGDGVVRLGDPIGLFLSDVHTTGRGVTHWKQVGPSVKNGTVLWNVGRQCAELEVRNLRVVAITLR